MVAITFDTLKFVETLEESGISKTQAKAISRALQDAQHESDVATKSDVRDIGSEVRALDGKFDGRFDSLDSKISLIQWMLLLIVIAVVAPHFKGLF
uniref:DUF1640 domain-containing protein n=1 Tax=Candidatus Kentrum sp. LFY TaxID=2126342 RepID=A0A450X0T6_9GAMM|nr:MAG: hypothetical protein BECKLFY1418C_GA0070996_11305 [Candidatus Kentron sp. LFY]